MLANFYLSTFDKIITEKGLHLVRFADDFIIMCKTKEEAIVALDFAKKFLDKKLGLVLKEEKTRIIDYRGGFDFLGFRVEAGQHSPSQKKIVGLKNKITALSNPRSGQTLFPILVHLNNLLKGWHEAYRRSNLGTLPQEINGHVIAAIASYLTYNQLIPEGKKLKSKQIRMLGIPRMPITPKS